MKSYFLKLIVLLFIVMVQEQLLAQGNQGGFIMPAYMDSFPSENAILMPKDGFVFFNKPNGEYAGRIEYGKSPIKVAHTLLYATLQWKNIRPTTLDLSYFFETSDDLFHVPFDRQQDGFVRIMTSPYEAWLPVASIIQKGFKTINWLDFYGIDQKLVYIPPDKTLPLKMSPYSDAEKLADLDNEHFVIKVIPYDNQQVNCCEGTFCYVEVVHYKENPCKNGDYGEKNIVKLMKGWLQIIDESGTCLVTHNPGGC